MITYYTHIQIIYLLHNGQHQKTQMHWSFSWPFPTSLATSSGANPTFFWQPPDWSIGIIHASAMIPQKPKACSFPLKESIESQSTPPENPIKS